MTLTKMHATDAEAEAAYHTDAPKPPATSTRAMLTHTMPAASAHTHPSQARAHSPMPVKP